MAISGALWVAAGDHPEIAAGLARQRPEYVVKVLEDSFWVIEAKGSHVQLDDAFSEAVGYAKDINKSSLVKARLVTGVAGNDDDGYLVTTSFIRTDGRIEQVKYNGRKITGFLSPEQTRYLVVASRTIIWSLVKQMWVRCVPLFHRLHRRLALER